MSREDPHIRVTVVGKLTGKKSYTPPFDLGILELWGVNTVPDDYVVEEEQLSYPSSLVVEDGDYIMEYEWNGQQVRKAVRVIGGRLLGRAA
jgi:hypothetical protein